MTATVSADRASLLRRAAARIAAAEELPRLGWLTAMELRDAGQLLALARCPEQAHLCEVAAQELSLGKLTRLSDWLHDTISIR